MRYNQLMQLDALDRLAAAVAAGMAADGDPAGVLASRAYEIAEALLQERQRRDGGGVAAWVEALPHQPSWELSPRWSREDRLALAAAEASLRPGPGLASVRPDRQDAAVLAGGKR